jgi:sulfatase maturation enzyme AslB (radical SAM superfamily)
MIALDSVKWLQVEATSKCNAWCPGCTRNNNGFGLVDNLVLEDLETNKFSSLLAQLPNLETIDFCGTFGDAIAASNILELTELAKAHTKRLMIRTNGSLRSTQWWEDYATLLKDTSHEVWFCLDGLADTHSIYRQGTDFNKIIANATAFIKAGGQAVWQFIPFKHNEHQLKDCLKLSQSLGFLRFELLKNVRLNFQPVDYRSGVSYSIEPWSRNKIVNSLTVKKDKVKCTNCMHLSLPSLYVNASGKINVCCYFNEHHANSNPELLLDIPKLLWKSDLVPQVCKDYCGTA